MLIISKKCFKSLAKRANFNQRYLQGMETVPHSFQLIHSSNIERELPRRQAGHPASGMGRRWSENTKSGPQPRSTLSGGSVHRGRRAELGWPGPRCDCPPRPLGQRPLGQRPGQLGGRGLFPHFRLLLLNHPFLQSCCKCLGLPLPWSQLILQELGGPGPGVCIPCCPGCLEICTRDPHGHVGLGVAGWG